VILDPILVHKTTSFNTPNILITRLFHECGIIG